MSFETIINNINNLERPISIDDLLESIMELIGDAREENQAQSFSVSDEVLYIKKLYNLVEFISKDYTDHSGIINDLMDRYSRYITEADNEIKELLKKSADEFQIVELKARKEAELEKERGHLLGLQDQNAELQKKIDILSDPHLDSIEEENERLRGDLAGRQSRKDSLIEENNRKNTEIKEVNSSIVELEAEESQLKKEKEERDEKRNSLDKSIEGIKKWIEEFDEWYVGVDKALVEATAQMSVMQTAWNSLSSDEPKIENLDEIKKWFEIQSKDVEKLLEAYRQRLRTVVQATGDMMKTKM